MLKRCSVYFFTSEAEESLYGLVHFTDSSFGNIFKLAGEKSPIRKTLSSCLPKWQKKNFIFVFTKMAANFGKYFVPSFKK